MDRNVQSYPQKACVDAGILISQAGATPDATCLISKSSQLSVDSGVPSVWMERKPAATPNFCE